MSTSSGFGARTIASRVVRRSREVGAALVFEAVSVLSMVIVFPLTARNLGPERYGEYTTLYVLAGLGMVWVYSGLGAAVVQLIMQLERKASLLIHQGHRQVMVVGTVAGVLGLGATAAILSPAVLLPAFIVFGSELFITGFAHVKVSVVLAVDGVKASTKVSVVRPIVRTLGVVALAAAGAVTLMSLVLVNLIAALALLGAATVATRRRLVAEGDRTTSSRRELARYSGYYSTSMSTNTVQEEGDKVIMAASRPPLELGEYMAAYRVVATALIPLRAVSVAGVRWFLPKDARVGGQVTRTMMLSVPTLVYGLACAAGILLLGDVIQWLVGDEFEEAVRITAWLCLVPLVHGLSELPFMGLLGLGRNRERMFLGFGTSVVAAGLYLVAIPPLGWAGAVIATYVSEIMSLVAGWILLVRYQRHADVENRLPSADLGTADPT
jgi:O-antigen/teichoic acid export membrane protein